MKTNKTDKKPKTIGQVKIINGVAVILPPEDEEDETQEETKEEKTETVIEQKQDTIIINTENISFEDDVQHVYDKESEKKSNELAKKVKKENDTRAKKATIETKPKKTGNSIVINSTSFDDLDLSLIDKEK